MALLFSHQEALFAQGNKSHWGSLYGSADVLALSEFVRQQSNVVLLIANDIAHFNQLHRSLEFYAADLDLVCFDHWEILPYDHQCSVHPDITSSRIQALLALEKLQRGIVLCTLEALTYRLCPAEFIQQHSFQVTCGDVLEIEYLSEQLLKVGYRRTPTVMAHGEFNVRGSLIDLFPMGAKQPYRLDLFDQEVESIRTFDVDTQRSDQSVAQISLLPGKEFATDSHSIEVFKSNYTQEFDNSSWLYNEIIEGRIPSGTEFYLPLFFNRTQSLFEYLPDNALVASFSGLSERVEANYQSITERFEQAQQNLDRPALTPSKLFLEKPELFSQLKQRQHVSLGSSALTQKPGHLNFGSKLLPPVRIEPQAPNPLQKFAKFVQSSNQHILIVCQSPGRQQLLIELLEGHQLEVKAVEDFTAFANSQHALSITQSELALGLMTPEVAIITEAHLFGQEAVAQQRRRRAKHKDFDEAISSLVEIKIGDPIVHENYGVGRYLGLVTQSYDGQSQDFLQLAYANDAKLMVPITSLNLISRYSGASVDHAPLHKLGTPQWSKAKQKASEALYDVAADLLEIYAKREASKGFAFDEPGDAYNTFVAKFPFEETPDQLKTMGEVLADMRSARPMDRLVCGDVGFGKTEIAMRAAFLAVESGKQVALLVPTTLLANQHYRSFVDRFADYPVSIESLSRFKSAKEQTHIIEQLAQGKIDILVGTHKIIQSGVRYQNLGLVIIDEEHRFGVKQKEALKKLRGEADILTMTATPIPRTLNMAMGSLRELSIIATPPAKRSAIQTFVQEWHDDNIKEACSRELHRGGQVFVLHNDIDSIDNMAAQLEALMPGVAIRIAHGQMPSKELERIMSDFYHGHFQVLVCTTIIETGIDIPNANTIIINNAQNFGLAQLHQLRGRVGRSHHKAYAYLLIKSHQSLSDDAKKRLDAIESLEELGAGFMLANHDLEIRGAGDLLGENQSGKISEIGFNLYHDLLKRTIRAIQEGKRINLDEPIHAEIEIEGCIPAIIPKTYVDDVHERLVLYKRIANCANDDALKELQIELIDRFGLLPEASKNLFASASLKLICEQLGVTKVYIDDDKALISFSDATPIEPIKIIKLVQQPGQHYQLKGQNQLIINQSMPEDRARFDEVGSLIRSLA